MPPKADYWKYFTIQGLLALCQIEGCPKPSVSLGSAPKNGGKKRISKSSNILASQYSSSLQLLEVWLDTWRNTMQKSGVPTARSGRGPKLRLRLSRRRRWRVVRWRTPRSGSMMCKGRLPFLAKVCFGKGYFMCLFFFLCRCCLTYPNPLSTGLSLIPELDF